MNTMILKKKFAVFGNPIHHSKSPIIHHLFAFQNGITQDYQAIFVPIGKILNAVSDFFIHSGQGANVTAPFKETVIKCCHVLTKRAEIAGSVNTLKKIKNNQLLGDNTDGIGILQDLKRLKFIKMYDKILLIGAGGAAKGIIEPILSLKCSVFITNRNMIKAENIAKHFLYFGDICPIDTSELKNECFDLIINATSSSKNNLYPNLPNLFISTQTSCYDLSYYSLVTPFLAWCQTQGAVKISNGIGMLVYQAAYSFLLWHGILPSINTVLNLLKFKKI